jgi:hypothetical protein
MIDLNEKWKQYFLACNNSIVDAMKDEWRNDI